MKGFLSLLICILALVPFVKGQDVDYDKIIPPTTADGLEYVDRLVQIAWKNWPQNTVVHQKLLAAKEEKAQANWGWLNAMNVQFQYFGANALGADETGGNRALPRGGVGLGVNLGALLLVPSKVRHARANRIIAEEDIKTQKLFIRAEVTRRYETYKTMQDMVLVISEALEDSRSSYIYGKKKFEGGELPLDDYNKAAALYHQTKERERAARMSLTEAKINLEELLGVTLEQIEQ